MWHVASRASAAASGEGAQRAMRMALRMAQLSADCIGYVNAHATSTLIGDIAECDAIRAVFGAEAARLPVSSTKSMTGHMLGAAGGVEAIFTILALHHGVVPPTINLEDLDPACGLDVVPNEARAVTIDAALSNGFGFGGTNATLLFRRLTR
jgi:3-oxoacyl-[acyl-carrier-protein] synthase II